MTKRWSWGLAFCDGTGSFANRVDGLGKLDFICWLMEINHSKY